MLIMMIPIITIRMIPIIAILMIPVTVIPMTVIIVIRMIANKNSNNDEDINFEAGLTTRHDTMYLGENTFSITKKYYP